MIISKNKIKLNKIALLIAVIHWLISFASDRLVFTYNLFDFSNMISIAKAMLAWGAKLAFLILLITIWHLIIYLFIELRNGNNKVRKYLRYTLLYLGAMFLFFIILYPGLWRIDEFGILKNAVNILPNFWQGYLTSVFFIFALMLVPTPAGVVVIQIGVISLIVGYIIYKCSSIISNKWLVYVMYIPFLLFPVIDSNFYPMRMSLYAFLELLFAFELFLIKYENREIKMKNIWILASLAGILVCWRTESIYYIVLAPITFIVLFYKETSKKTKITFAIATVVIASTLTSIQTIGNKIESGKDYEITSVILPITPLISKASQDGEEEMLLTIDKVLDTVYLINGYKEGKTGIKMYWENQELKRDYTSEDFSDLKRVYYKLIMKYPEVFLKERLETFIGSTGILGKTENLFADNEAGNYVDFRETYHYNTEPFLRSETIKLLEFTDNVEVHNIIYSFIPQAIILIGACFVLLFKKKWGYFFICANICAKIPLIFLTAPSRLFMYYYSIYLVGAVLIGMIVVFIIDKRFNNMK